MNEVSLDTLNSARAKSQVNKERPESPVSKSKEKVVKDTQTITEQYKTEKDDSIKIFSPKAE